MNFKKVFIFIFLVFSIFPFNLNAQTANTGFVSANIWYSKDPLEEGDKVKIYTFIFNPDTRELSGTVIFFDKTVLLGKKDFVIPARGAEDVSIDWTVTAGDHTIFGKIENAKFLVSKGTYQEVYLPENETEKSSLSISKKIITKTTNTKNDTTGTSVSDIKNIIEEKTPDFITKPIISTTNVLEEFRQDTTISSENKKKEIKKEIDVLNNTKNTVNSKKEVSPLLKPFKYVEVFFLSIFVLILGNKVIFYGLIVIVIFFILRFILKKIF
jgi:hypothetical protein